MVISLAPYKVRVTGRTDVGLVRQNNEDEWDSVPSIGLYVLADGMGGHQAGEVASKETVALLIKLLKKKLSPKTDSLSLDECKDLLDRAIRYVNRSLIKMSLENPEYKGMGTTLCCLLFRKEGVIFAHVGDSRIYQFRNGTLKRLTKDHSLLSELVDQGKLDHFEIQDFAYKNIITKAVGTDPKLVPEIDSTDVMIDDIYLMCTDGLTDCVSDEELASSLIHNSSGKAAVEGLVAQANERGGQDNITVVLTKIGEVPAS